MSADGIKKPSLPFTSSLADSVKKDTSLKERGNEHMKKKEYADAYECYTKALSSEEEPLSAVVYGNRAQAALSLHRYRHAVTETDLLFPHF